MRIAIRNNSSSVLMDNRTINRKLAALVCIIFLPTATALCAEKTEIIGNWEYISNTDKLTDKPFYTAALKSIDAKFTLGIKCDAPPHNSIYIMLVSPIYLGKGTSYYRGIKYRFDSGPITQEGWHFEGNRAMNLDRGLAKKFAENLTRSSRLVMNAHTWNFSNVVEPEFNVVGSGPAINRVLRDCKS
jgi:hypothetical protein